MQPVCSAATAFAQATIEVKLLMLKPSGDPLVGAAVTVNWYYTQGSVMTDVLDDILQWSLKTLRKLILLFQSISRLFGWKENNPPGCLDLEL